MKKIIIANSKKWFNLSKIIEKEHQILTLSRKEELNLKDIKKFSPDLIFFPHWNWIVPSDIYENYTCIVFHTAPLPYGKGGSPIQNLILLGYDNSPVCALRMTEELDSGPIYLTKNVSLDGSLKDIFIRLNLILNDIIRDLIISLPEPNVQKGKEFIFKRLNESDNFIPLDVSMSDFFDRIRMVDEETYPNAYINYGSFKIEFSDVSFSNGEINCKAIIKKLK